MKVKPLNSKVLIRPDGSQSETDSGLLVYREDAEQVQTGTVIEIGQSVRAVCVSDKVMYEKFAGSSIEIDSATYLIMDEADIVAVLNNL